LVIRVSKVLPNPLLRTKVSNTLIYFAQMMADNPEAQAQVQEEIDGLVPADQFVDLQHVEQLTLLWVAIKETLRLRPLFTVVTARATLAPVWWRNYLLPLNTFLCVRGEALSLERGGAFDLSRHSTNPRLDLNGRTDLSLPVFGEGGSECFRPH
jgi:hypothetical protein